MSNKNNNSKNVLPYVSILIYFSEAVFLQENIVLKNKQNYMYIGLQFIVCIGFVFFCLPLTYLGDLW